MKTRTARRLTALLCPALVMSGCASLPEVGTALTDQQRADAQKQCVAQYTAMGAIGGSLIGMLISSKSDRTQGALLGAVAGGALAFNIAWGKCLKYYSDVNSFPVADARQTAAAIGYTASRGNVVRIQSFLVTPAELAPGGSLRLTGAYYVMAPEGQHDIKVIEKRTVHFYNEAEKSWTELGSEETPVTSALGTRRAEGQTQMPKEMAEGRYRITFEVRALDRQDVASQEIVVRKS